MKWLNQVFILFSILLVVMANTTLAKPADYPKTGLMKIYYDAVNNNSDLAAAKAQYGAKQEIVPQARSGLLPQISADANYDDIRTVLDTPTATIKRNTYTYGVSLSQPLFRVDRWFQLQAANATSEQARLEFAVVQQQLILNTAQAYFAILQAQDNLAANKAEENAYKRQADEAQTKFRLGLADKTDYLQAKAAYDMSRANRIVTQKAVYDAFQALTTLTNKHYEAIEGMRHNLPIRLPIPNDAQAWVSKAVNQNLSLQAGSYGVSAAEKTLKQRKAGHAPTVDLVASYKKGDNDAFKFSNSAASATHYGSEVSQKTVGIELQVPLYSGGMTSSQVREARSSLTMIEQNHESLRRKVVQNTRDYHRAINSDIEQIHALKLSIISSQSAVEATQIGFESGTKDIVDVLDAQQRLYDAVRNYNNARYAYVLDVLNLKLYVGSLSPADLQELEAYLNPNYNPDKDFLPTDMLKNHIINKI